MTVESAVGDAARAAAAAGASATATPPDAEPPRRRRAKGRRNSTVVELALEKKFEHEASSEAYVKPRALLPHAADGAHVQGLEAYLDMYADSVEDPEQFWAGQARALLDWDSPFTHVLTGAFETGDVAWFRGGRLNPCVQCVDRHVDAGRGDEVAIIWEADEPGQHRSFTYLQLLHEVCRLANVLRRHGVRKGDAVTLYMPMVPETAFVMLACARIGAPHSVVFAGFSAEALRDRIQDVRSRWVFTCDEGVRGGRTIALKRTLDAALLECPFVERVFVFGRTGAKVGMVDGRDVLVGPEAAGMRPYCPPEQLDAEDTLFYLYTSGSTGAPKAQTHTVAGYLLFASLTHKLVFDYRPGDVFACMADCGWITGHTYIVYGPLANGAATLMFESTPLYPTPSRYWQVVQTHRVTQFYTAPTAIRALMRHGTGPLEGFDLSTLRVLGSVGEVLNGAAWEWYHEHVGQSRCAIVDTYWQTETGGVMLAPMPGATPAKPGCTTLPFLGVDLELLDPHTAEPVPSMVGERQSGVLCVKHPWPGMSRTVYGNHERYMSTYFRPYPGYYFTGDACTRDEDGYYWITGRVDDVLNVSGHRIGAAEVESALVAYEAVAEAAVVGFPHAVKGEGLACYCVLRQGYYETPELLFDLRKQVRAVIGTFAMPDFVVVASALPTTRSGKLMRRLLRKALTFGDEDGDGADDAPLDLSSLGDLSTLRDPSIMRELVEKVMQLKQWSRYAAERSGGSANLV